MTTQVGTQVTAQVAAFLNGWKNRERSSKLPVRPKGCGMDLRAINRTRAIANCTRVNNRTVRYETIPEGEGRGVHYEPARKDRADARSGMRTPVSGSKPPDSAQRASGSRKGKEMKGRG